MLSFRAPISAVTAFTVLLLAQMAPLPAASQTAPTIAQSSGHEVPPRSDAGHPPEASDAAAGRAVTAGAADGWHAVVVSGTVRFMTADLAGTAAWGDVAAGQVFAVATEFEVGADGHLLLFNGHDALTVSPGSRLVVPEEASPAERIRILQDLGTVRYDVESRHPAASGVGALLTRVRHALTSDGPPGALFEVRTPHLVVVVKGTSFTITVTSHETRVTVAQGVVEVRDPLSGEVVDVSAGQSVLRGLLEHAGVVVEAVPAALLDDLAKAARSAGDASADTVAAVGETVDSPTAATSGDSRSALGTAPTAGQLLERAGSPLSGGSSRGGGTSDSGSSSGGSGSSSSGGGSGGGGSRDTARDTVSRSRDTVSDALGL